MTPVPLPVLAHFDRTGGPLWSGMVAHFQRNTQLSIERRRKLVDCRHPSLSVVKQCRLSNISRSGLYYKPVGNSDKELTFMKMIDNQYLSIPFYGARRMALWLKERGYKVNRKRIQRLMRIMGLRTIYQRPRTSKPALGHKIYPYLLRDVKVTRQKQVWAAVRVRYGYKRIHILLRREGWLVNYKRVYVCIASRD